MYVPGEKKCQEIGLKFVNDRLIKLMDDAIISYVAMYDSEDRYRERIKCSADWEKPLEEIMDLDRLSQDEKFFDEYLDMMGLVPVRSVWNAPYMTFSPCVVC